MIFGVPEPGCVVVAFATAISLFIFYRSHNILHSGDSHAARFHLMCTLIVWLLVMCAIRLHNKWKRFFVVVVVASRSCAVSFSVFNVLFLSIGEMMLCVHSKILSYDRARMNISLQIVFYVQTNASRTSTSNRIDGDGTARQQNEHTEMHPRDEYAMVIGVLDM